MKVVRDKTALVLHVIIIMMTGFENEAFYLGAGLPPEFQQSQANKTREDEYNKMTGITSIFIFHARMLDTRVHPFCQRKKTYMYKICSRRSETPIHVPQR